MVKKQNSQFARFINGLTLAGIEVDRKVLADLAVHEPDAFSAIVEQDKGALPAYLLVR